MGDEAGKAPSPVISPESSNTGFVAFAPWVIFSSKKPAAKSRLRFPSGVEHVNLKVHLIDLPTLALSSSAINTEP
jgi:hypothetical protein